ncbi:Ankyrin repeat protein [Dirofilaria immitis]|nr:Ankyrin repeat protein [Dirofilaria immitis]
MDSSIKKRNEIIIDQRFETLHAYYKYFQIDISKNIGGAWPFLVGRVICLVTKNFHQTVLRMPSMATDEAETNLKDLEYRIMNLDFNARKFTELENLQITGRLKEVGRIVGKYLNNESLSLIHVAVCRERHEIVEYLATAFPNSIDILDVNGRAAIHYAATQKNAIYDTLIDCGANGLLADKIGITAAQYREDPNAILPSPLLSSIDDPSFKRYSLSENIYDPGEKWLEDGDIKQLEQILLDGRGHLLADKTSDDFATSQFLNRLSKYQNKIDTIHKAVEEGDIDQMIMLMDSEKLSIARDRFGMTPLHIAVLHGQTNIVRHLLAKYPYSVNATNHTGRTALHYAFANHCGDAMMKMLQKAGADFGHAPLYYQNNSNQLDAKMMIKDNDQMDQLIAGQATGSLLQDVEEDISNWIHNGNIRKLDELVLNGYADLLSCRSYETDDPDVRHFLDALPQYQVNYSLISINFEEYRSSNRSKKMAFCRDSRHLTPLHKAVILGQTEIAKYLIKNYPQVTNAMDENKRTPFHYAAALPDDGYLYKMMRNAGANSKISDCYGRRPSYYLKNPAEIDFKAINTAREAILDEIIRNRTASSCLESNIRQWLHDGNIGKLEQLVLSGCGDLLDEIDEIHKAIRKGDLKHLKELFTSKKLAIARNRFGRTPLHTAILYEQTEIIRYINKRTPLHYAAATHDGGHYVKILVKAGADQNAMDIEGHTPHYYCLNNVINLELLREIDDDNGDVAISENLADIPHSDSILSSGSVSVMSSSHISISSKEEDETNEYKFGYDMPNDIVLPSNSNAIYLSRTVAPVLTGALTEVLLQRPTDPILFIADWLIQYREKNPLLQL